MRLYLVVFNHLVYHVIQVAAKLVIKPFVGALVGNSVGDGALLIK